MLWPVENVPMLSNNTEKLLFQSLNCISQFYSRYNHMRQWRTVNTTLEWPQLVSPPLQSSGSETLFVLRFHCRKTKTMTSLLVQSQSCGLVNYEKRGKGLSTMHCAIWWRNSYVELGLFIWDSDTLFYNENLRVLMENVFYFCIPFLQVA